VNPNIPAVKIIRLIIRPIGRHHPQSSSLPHVDTGLTVTSIFGTLPGSPFLSECQALSAIRPGSPHCYQTSFSFIHGNRKKSQGAKSMDESQFIFRQKLLGEDGSVRGGVVMVKQSCLLSPKFGATSSHVFTQSPQNVAVEPGIHSLVCRDRCFALQHLLYRWRHQSGIFWIPPRIGADGYQRFGSTCCVNFTGLW
jgi:hypothetical protein